MRDKAIDILVFVVTAGGLLLAAIYTEAFVPKGVTNPKVFDARPIEGRDNYYGVTQIGEQLVWMAGKNGKIIHSEDGGQTWQIQTTGVKNHLQDLDAWDENRAVAVGNGGIVLRSENGGKSWQEVEAPKSEVANKLLRVKVYPGGRAWAVGVLGALLFSTDYGVTWERRLEEKDSAWNDIAFLDGQTGWLVGEFGKIMRTGDGGSTWQEVRTPMESSLMAIAFRTPTEGIIAGLNGTIVQTLDGGQSWREVAESGTTEHLFEVFWSGREWVIVGNKGIIITGNPADNTWVAKRLSETELAWHTSISGKDSKLFIVGGTQGVRIDGKWSYLR
jgi:hypothetical protein